MKTVIASLNSKYIHSALAPWYLKEYCGSGFGEIKVMEFTINSSIDMILSGIYNECPDVAAFSCYIWNIGLVLKVAQDLKKVLPKTKVVLGGPEVSFDAEELLNRYPFVDYIVEGEGERAFRKLLHDICALDGSDDRPGKRCAVYRDESLIPDLDELPSPFSEEMLGALGDRIVYFESSRGCPFSCSYCLSSTFSGVRFFSMDRVRRELSRLIDRGTGQVKFVDRTFNCNKNRAMEIFEFIIRSGGNTRFHFEAAADLFDDEMIDLLSHAPSGMIQFEIGIQTTCRKALSAVDRRTDLDKAFRNIRKLRELENIHLHLDLIAGLPYEDYAAFKNSFNNVYGLRPHHLQLGFLKMLKGSKIRGEKELYDYRFREYPPYEFLSNRYLPYSDVVEIKGVEEVLERYFNSQKFNCSLDYLIRSFYDKAYDFYHDLYRFNLEKGYLDKPLSMRDLYRVLSEFAAERIPEEHLPLLNELLKFDYFSSNASRDILPFIKRKEIPGFKERCFDFLKEAGNVNCFLPHLSGMAAKDIYKKVHFEVFEYNVLAGDLSPGINKEETIVLFDYSSQDKVTGLYKHHPVNFNS